MSLYDKLRGLLSDRRKYEEDRIQRLADKHLARLLAKARKDLEAFAAYGHTSHTLHVRFKYVDLLPLMRDELRKEGLTVKVTASGLWCCWRTESEQEAFEAFSLLRLGIPPSKVKPEKPA